MKSLVDDGVIESEFTEKKRRVNLRATATWRRLTSRRRRRRRPNLADTPPPKTLI